MRGEEFTVVGVAWEVVAGRNKEKGRELRTGTGGTKGDGETDYSGRDKTINVGLTREQVRRTRG